MVKILKGKVLTGFQYNWSRLDLVETDQEEHLFMMGGITENLQSEQKSGEIQKRIEDLNNKNVKYILSGKDLTFFKCHPEIDFTEWRLSQAMQVKCTFPNNSSINISYGCPYGTDFEMIFERSNDLSWHQKYNGNHGYFITHSPTMGDKPKLHHYSCSIGTNNDLYSVSIHPLGIGNIEKLT